jgi:hypothetical protein
MRSHFSVRINFISSCPQFCVLPVLARFISSFQQHNERTVGLTQSVKSLGTRTPRNVLRLLTSTTVILSALHEKQHHHHPEISSLSSFTHSSLDPTISRAILAFRNGCCYRSHHRRKSSLTCWTIGSAGSIKLPLAFLFDKS